MKKRVPLQVAPEFRDALKKLQGELLLKGKDLSLRDITFDIAISGQMTADQIKQEIKIRMDKRRKYV